MHVAVWLHLESQERLSIEAFRSVRVRILDWEEHHRESYLYLKALHHSQPADPTIFQLHR